MKRKILIAGVVMCLGAGAFAQTSTVPGRTTVGITGGVNMFNINGKNAAGAELKNDLNTGFNAGVNVEFPLGTGTYLQPGVEFRTKGTEWTNGNKTTLSYVDVPVNLIIKPTLGTTSNLLIGFGPYVGFGVDGKVKYANGVEREVMFTNDYVGSEATDVQYQRLDAGANALAGVEFNNRFSIMAKAQLGLKNINPEGSVSGDQTRYRNTGFGLSLGYRF